MEQDKLLKLVLRLSEKTVQDQVNWSKTSESNIFLASFRDFSVLLQEGYQGEYMESEYWIMITNRGGDVVEKISSYELNEYNSQKQTRYDVNFFDELKKLFAAARRYALGIDQAIDSILEQLEEDPEKIPF